MEGESSGVQQAQSQVEQGENQRQGWQEPGVDAQAEQRQNQQEPQTDAVSGGDTDYAAQLKAKDVEIEALQAKVAEAPKTAEATERLGKEIADLKARLANERTEFALRSAGARSVTTSKALLAEHNGGRGRAREGGAVALRDKGLEPGLRHRSGAGRRIRRL